MLLPCRQNTHTRKTDPPPPPPPAPTRKLNLFPWCSHSLHARNAVPVTSHSQICRSTSFRLFKMMSTCKSAYLCVASCEDCKGNILGWLSHLGGGGGEEGGKRKWGRKSHRCLLGCQFTFQHMGFSWNQSERPWCGSFPLSSCRRGLP